jgi:hypothetical protein
MSFESFTSELPHCAALQSGPGPNSENGEICVTEVPSEPQDIPAKSPYIALRSDLKEIRVLEVAPGTGNDIVTCTLKHISILDDPVPFYETISYCWGSSGVTTPINLDNFLVSVPSSSEAALRRMRFSGKPRVLWIDAICIDQSSLSERSDQVTFMSTIYSLSKQNLVYLGEDDAGLAERANKSVQSLISEMRMVTRDFESCDGILWDKGTGSFLYSSEGFHTRVDFAALEKLFDLAWFS